MTNGINGWYRASEDFAFGQKHARNWSLRLPKEGIESNTNYTRNQL
jgi:hypothetical protein